jgi:hypothetical protein
LRIVEKRADKHRDSTDLFQLWVQLLRQREVTMWMPQGLSCPDCPFFIESSNMEIPTRIRGVLALEANPSLVPSPVPRRERVERL